MPTWWRLLAAGMLIVLAACAAGESGGAGGAVETSPTTAASSEEQPTEPPVEPTEPPVEPTEPESAQPTREEPSIEIANAPIGGQRGFGPSDCVALNWLGRTPIPEGVTIKLGTIRLDPEGIFELDPDSCSGDDESPSCAGLEWEGDDPADCYVGARQTAFGGEETEVLVILAVTVSCTRKADCDDLAADPDNKVGSSVVFESDPEAGGPSESPSESESESPSEAESSEGESSSESQSSSESSESPSDG